MERKVRRLLEAQGVRGQLEKVISAFSSVIVGEIAPSVPEGKAEACKESALDWAMERVLSIYGEHCNEEAIDAAIAFYESRLGQAVSRAEAEMFQRLSGVAEKALQKFEREVTS